MKKIIAVLILFLIALTNIHAQLGNTHWLPALHSRSAGQVNDHYIYLSTPFAKPFVVTLTNGTNTQSVSISQGNPARVYVGNGQPSAMFIDQSDLNKPLNNKGYVLSASYGFYASFRVRSASQAGYITTKGESGLGTAFRLGSLPQLNTSNNNNFFASFMASEDNTSITVSDYDTNVQFKASNGGTLTDNTLVINLNKGESYVLSGYTDIAANNTGFVGALVTSDKPIVVNTGNALGGISGQSRDFTIDQIVPISEIGTQYAVVAGNGSANAERPLVIATENNTQVFINGTLQTTLANAGDYIFVSNSQYRGTTHKNMYIETSKPAYVYQFVGGSSGDQTIGMNFIPPLNCFFQKEVDLIPSIDKIGSTDYSGDLIVITRFGASISINGNTIATTPEALQGNTEWVTYRLGGYSNNTVVTSTEAISVGLFGFDGGNAGFGGYYSGFGVIPKDTEIKICDAGTTILLDQIDGNPDSGGIWTDPNGNPHNGIFDPAVDILGIYNYYLTGSCEIIDVDLNITEIVTPENPGIGTSIDLCKTDANLDLFSQLLGTPDTAGEWRDPNGFTFDGILNPLTAIDGIYTYGFYDTPPCDFIESEISVTIHSNPDTVQATNFVQCDDAVDGDDTNGFTTFDLNTKTTEIINGQANILVSYHADESNALSKSNALSTMHYTSSSTIYARLEHSVSGCFSVTSFSVIVYSLPTVPASLEFYQCDTDLDGITYFNLDEATLSFNDTPEHFTTTYYEDNPDVVPTAAEILDSSSFYSGETSVWARTSSNVTNCHKITEVALRISATNIAGQNFYRTISVCDDETLDGVSTFDLTPIYTELKTTLFTDPNTVISIYITEEDALLENNAIQDLTQHRNTNAPTTQTLFVRVDDILNNACIGLAPSILLTVDEPPNFDLGIDFTMCVDTFTGLGHEVLDATPNRTGNYNYMWTPENPNKDAFGNELPIYTITTGGEYSVVVTNIDTDELCYAADRIQIGISSAPETVSSVLLTPIFSGNSSTIEVTTSGGFGDYEFQIDNGQWQDSPIFEGITSGTHAINVRATSYCGPILSTSISSISYPLFFTPNQDSINDTWNITGLDASFQASILIYDRYGNFITQISPYSEGWDGSFLNKRLVSSDYWFQINYTENEIQKSFKSHFTLKR